MCKHISYTGALTKLQNGNQSFECSHKYILYLYPVCVISLLIHAALLTKERSRFLDSESGVRAPPTDGEMLHYAPEVIWTAVVTTPFFIHQKQSKKWLVHLNGHRVIWKRPDFQIAPHPFGDWKVLGSWIFFSESKVMQMSFLFSSAT